MNIKIFQLFEGIQVFINTIKSIDRWIVFCTMGLYLLATILVYRWSTICLKMPFLFKEYSFYSIDNAFWEPLYFCYLSSLFFGFFLI